MTRSSQPAPPRRRIDRVADAVGGGASSLVLGVGSALRSARVVHPRGRAFHGTLRASGARHVILARVGYGETFYSTIDRLGVGGRAVLLGGRASFTGAPRTPARLSELADAIGEGAVSFDLSVTTPSDTAWHPAAALRLGSEVAPEVSESLRFTPFHRAGGLEPIGVVVNALRRLGYEGSQRGRS